MVFKPNEPPPSERQRSAPNPLAGDLSNIFISTSSALYLSSRNLGYGMGSEALASLDDDSLMKVVRETRKSHKVKTIEEYLVSKKYDPREEREQADQFPEEVAKTDSIVDILNTTEDPIAFRQAMNKGFALTHMRSDYRLFPQPEYNPELLGD